MENELVSRLRQHYPFLRLNSIEYFKSKQECVFDFLYPSTNEITLDDKRKIVEIIKDYLCIDCVIKTNYKVSYLHKEAIKKHIFNFVRGNFKVISLDEKNIDVYVNSINCEVKLLLEENIKDLVEKVQFVLNLKNNLEQNFFAEFNIFINYKQSDKVDISVLDERKKQLLKTIKPVMTVSSYFQVTDVKSIYGNKLIDKAMNISAIKSDMQDVYVAGKVYFIQRNTYKKKVEIDGLEKEQEKVRFNFELRDNSGKINCVLFPVKAIASNQDILKNGDEIIALCSVDNYQNKLNLKVKEFGYCKLPDFDALPTIYLPENDVYMYISPERYIDHNQSSFFEEKLPVPTYLKNKTFVVFDLETTGLDEDCKIIEIGAVKIENGQLTESFSCLINPKMHIPDEATAVNNITDEMVAEAYTAEQVIPDFYKFTRGSILVAHNISYDIGVLRRNARLCHYNFDNDILDTLELSRKYIPGLKNYKNITVCKHFGIDIENAHRALDDTIGTAKAFMNIASLIVE